MLSFYEKLEDDIFWGGYDIEITIIMIFCNNLR